MARELLPRVSPFGPRPFTVTIICATLGGCTERLLPPDAPEKET